MEEHQDINELQLAGTSILDLTLQVLFFKYVADDSGTPLSQMTDADLEFGLRKFKDYIIDQRNEPHDLECTYQTELMHMDCKRCISDKFHREAVRLLSYQGFVPT